MNKKDIYIQALSNRWQACLLRDWMLCAFTVSEYKEDLEHFPFQVKYTEEATEVLMPKVDAPYTYGDNLMFENEFKMEDYDWVKVDGVEPMTPLYRFGDFLTLEENDLVNVHGTKHTSYGDMLFNASVIVPSFYDKIDYFYTPPADDKSISDPINIWQLESEIAARLVDDPEELINPTGTIKQFPRVRAGNKAPIFVRERVIFATAMDAYGTYCQYFVKAISPKSLTTDPAYKELRNKLVEKYKDKLHDSATQVLIQNELIELDRKWLENDDVKWFYLKDKTYTTARKRMLTIHGPEAGFNDGGEGELIISNLTEGWDPKKLPPMINSSRAGSFFRGFETAMGGEVVKFFLRIFQNTSIEPGDCGTHEGLNIVVDEWVAKRFEGFYLVNKDKKPELITKEFLKANIGNRITVRFPFMCKSLKDSFCSICVGSQNATQPRGIGASTTSIGSQFMLISMASAHAKENRTVKIDMNTFFER